MLKRAVYAIHRKCVPVHGGTAIFQYSLSQCSRICNGICGPFLATELQNFIIFIFISVLMESTLLMIWKRA